MCKANTRVHIKVSTLSGKCRIFGNLESKLKTTEMNCRSANEKSINTFNGNITTQVNSLARIFDLGRPRRVIYKNQQVLQVECCLLVNICNNIPRHRCVKQLDLFMRTRQLSHVKHQVTLRCINAKINCLKHKLRK